jgi:hypothetical protein
MEFSALLDRATDSGIIARGTILNICLNYQAVKQSGQRVNSGMDSCLAADSSWKFH